MTPVSDDNKFGALVLNRGCHLQYSGVPRANWFSNICIIKNTTSKCHSALKQIAMGSPLGAANCISEKG